jgi:hypothetical protein
LKLVGYTWSGVIDAAASFRLSLDLDLPSFAKFKDLHLKLTN